MTERRFYVGLQWREGRGRCSFDVCISVDGREPGAWRSRARPSRSPATRSRADGSSCIGGGRRAREEGAQHRQSSERRARGVGRRRNSGGKRFFMLSGLMWRASTNHQNSMHRRSGWVELLRRRLDADGTGRCLIGVPCRSESSRTEIIHR